MVSRRAILSSALSLVDASHMVECEEHRDCTIPGGASTVLRAWYGNARDKAWNGCGWDVTADVKLLIANETRVEASNENFGNACEGKFKRLFVEVQDSSCSTIGNLECVGGDLPGTTFKATSMEQCCDHCANTKGCRAWTWNSVFNKNCHLKYACLKQRGDWARRSGLVGGAGANAEVVASTLNDRYFGFDPNNDKSPLGLTITMHHELAIFCKTPCYNGHADCRMSASLYNKRMLLTRSGNRIKFGLERRTGYVWHQEIVETMLNKCSYIFDGSSFQRYNGACGCGASGKCSKSSSAYGNVCPSTGKQCKVADKEVESCSCDAIGEPKDINHYQCFFKGPALDNKHLNMSRDQLRWMAKTRVKSQTRGFNQIHDPLEYWNEIVLDEQLMIPLLKKDAAAVVQAFIYERGSTNARNTARKMRDEFVSKYPTSAEIPIIAVDTKMDVGHTKHIFFAENLLSEDVEQFQELSNVTVV